MIQTVYSKNFKLQSSTILLPETRKKYFKWRQIWSKDGDGNRQRWLGDEVGRAKNILPRSQILTNGETPLERDGWSKERELVLNEKKNVLLFEFWQFE